MNTCSAVVDRRTIVVTYRSIIADNAIIIGCSGIHIDGITLGIPLSKAAADPTAHDRPIEECADNFTVGNMEVASPSHTETREAVVKHLAAHPAHTLNRAAPRLLHQQPVIDSGTNPAVGKGQTDGVARSCIGDMDAVVAARIKQGIG